MVLCLLGVVLAACSPAPKVPTPLPTAVPPINLPEQGSWAVGFEYEFPPGIFGLSPHRYAFLIHCPVISSEDSNSGWHYFEISEDVVRQPDTLYLRLFGLSGSPINPSKITNTMIHPERPIVAVVHLVGMTKEAANLAAAACEIVVFWDDTGRQLLVAGEPFQP
jgi:hypothetical protein